MLKTDIQEIFDNKFKKRLLKAIYKSIRKAIPFVIIISVVFYFWCFAIIPTESMYPTLKKKDLVLVSKDVKKIERKDVIAFVDNEKKAIIKRVVGVPGDTIEILNGIVYVNNKAINESYIKEPIGYDYPKIIVPKDKYFVLGDNRNNSYDSHYWGFLNKEQIRGKCKIILLPIKHFYLF